MSLLLNKIPVLDKGFIARLDSSLDSTKLNEIAVEYFKRLDGKFLADTSTLTMLIKCPLFVQLNLSTFNFKITSLPHPAGTDLEVYLPNVGEIGAAQLDICQDIASDMAHTCEALMMNQKAYQTDGCDKFLSQILMPINTYTTLIVHGQYNDWSKWISQSAPSCISAYLIAAQQIIKAEWR